MWIAYWISLLLISTVSANFNFYVSKPEVHRLVGLNSEWRYVSNGTVNDYSLSFTVLVPVTVQDLFFTWQNTASKPVVYAISFTLDNPEVMFRPQLSIPKKGNLPKKEEKFRVILPCTGRVSAEVEVNINVEFKRGNNVTHLTLKRMKICEKSNNTIVAKKSGVNTVQLVEESTSVVPHNNDTLIICVSVLGSLIAFSAIGLLYFYCRKPKDRRANTIRYGDSSPTLSASNRGNAFLRPDTPNNSSSANSYASLKQRLTPVPPTTETKERRSPDITEQIANIRIGRRKILLKERVMEGTFGQVYHAVLRDDDILTPRGYQVLVKTVTEHASAIQISLFTTEGMMMLGKNDPNILPLMGLCTDDPYHPLLIYPFCGQGNLKKFLHKHFLAEPHGHTLSHRDLVAMALQIGEGIDYLHEKGVIHKDIATRNCVVDENFHVRITDPALARDLFPSDYHCLGDNENRPIGWLALESLVLGEYSDASDVWAFGVTMWELVTLGQQPYAEINPYEMHSFLRDGYRLDQPKNCTDELFQLMCCCWMSLPENRPSVSYLIQSLQRFHRQLGLFI